MKIRFEDLEDLKIKAIQTEEFPVIDDNVFDIELNGLRAVRGVSGMDGGLTNLFASYFYDEDIKEPMPEDMAEFRIGKLVAIMKEILRLADEFGVSFDGYIEFDGKRRHPHRIPVEGDKIVGKSEVVRGELPFRKVVE